MSFLNSLFSQKIKTYFKKFRKFNGLNKLDKKMLKYINYPNGYYIECGANDGVDQSNTWYLEKYLDWQGILIEPLKQQFIELKKNRDYKNNFYNVALSADDNVKTLILSENNLKSEIVNSIDNEKKYSTSKAMTLTKILDETSAPKLIDFFSLDVEGYEQEVLKGINFDKYNFKFFLIETKNEEVFSVLENKNYKITKKLSYHDYLFEYK